MRAESKRSVAFSGPSLSTQHQSRAFGKQHAGGHAKSAGGQIKLGIFGDVDEKEALLRLARDAVRKQVLMVLGIEERRTEREEE